MCCSKSKRKKMGAKKDKQNHSLYNKTLTERQGQVLNRKKQTKFICSNHLQNFEIKKRLISLIQVFF